MLEGRRAWCLAACAALAWLLTLGALVVLACRPSVQPFLLRTAADGAVVAATAPVLVPYQPGEAEQHYFLAQFARELLALDARQSAGWLEAAYALTRGKAQTEFAEWVAGAGNLRIVHDDPTVTRSVRVISVARVADGVALVRVATELRSLARPAAQPGQYVVTVHFRTDPPRREADLLRNPVGLVVTDFQVQEEAP